MVPSETKTDHEEGILMTWNAHSYALECSFNSHVNCTPGVLQ